MNKIDVSSNLVLRETETADLDTLFSYQFDDGAAWMAAFMNESWRDKDFYLRKWNNLLKDNSVNAKTIVLDGIVVGSISTWRSAGVLQITYWIGKEYWNRGIATRALQKFLNTFSERPVFGRVASDNIGSAQVLTNCGFKKVGEETGYASMRQREIKEIVFKLDE